MAKTVAVIRGTALKPGVSRNGRYYTAEAIARAVDRARERIAEGLQPLTMMTCHAAAAGGPVTEVCGRITELALAPDGSATYTAAIAGNKAGQDVLQLIDTSDGEQPFLRGVSIRGDWCEDPRVAYVDGVKVTTADDLEIDGLDFTHRPGVIGAEVTDVELLPGGGGTATREEAANPRRITESVQEARVSTMTAQEAAVPAAPPVVAEAVEAVQPAVWADNGYLPDNAKRYPLDNLDQARAAFAVLQESVVRRGYTAAQLKRIDGRIRKVLESHGIEVDRGSGWMIQRGEVTEDVDQAGVTEYYGDERCGSVYVSIDNGHFSISVNSYRKIDPHDLDRVARSAMDGACAAMAAIAPELDEAPAFESTQRAATVTETAPEQPAAAAGDGTAPTGADPNTDEEEAAVSEPTNTPAVAAPVGITLTDEQFAALLAKVTPTPAPAQAVPAGEETAAPVESAAAVPVVETATAAAVPAPVAAAVTETEEQRVARLVAEGVQAQIPVIMQQLAQNGAVPQRKGLVQGGTVTEATGVAAAPGTSAFGYPEGWPQKPLHEYTPEEYRQHVTPTTGRAILGSRFDA